MFYLKGAKEGLNVLPEEESKHCVKVLRMTEGEYRQPHEQAAWL